MASLSAFLSDGKKQTWALSFSPGAGKLCPASVSFLSTIGAFLYTRKAISYLFISLFPVVWTFPPWSALKSYQEERYGRNAEGMFQEDAWCLQCVVFSSPPGLLGLELRSWHQRGFSLVRPYLCSSACSALIDIPPSGEPERLKHTYIICEHSASTAQNYVLNKPEFTIVDKSCCCADC